MGARHAAGGCVLLGSVTEYDDRPGVLHDQVLHNEQRWRDELAARGIQLAIDCGHLRDGDTDQYAFELYAIPLAVHHEAGLFGYDVPARHGDAAVERWIAAHSPTPPELPDEVLAMASLRCPELARSFALNVRLVVRARRIPASAACSTPERPSRARRPVVLHALPLVAALVRSLRPTLGAPRAKRSTSTAHRIATYVWGDPDAQPYVLFAHGWSSHGTRIAPWVRAAAATAGYAVVAFDQAAHGSSGGTQTTLPDFACHLLAVGAPLRSGRRGGRAFARRRRNAVALARGLQAERAVLIAPAADPLVRPTELRAR